MEIVERTPVTPHPASLHCTAPHWQRPDERSGWMRLYEARDIQCTRAESLLGTRAQNKPLAPLRGRYTH